MDRFKLNPKQKLQTFYETPGKRRCLLQNDDDLKMLFLAARTYKMEIVELVAVRESRPSEVVECSDRIDINLACEEESYLGVAFRSTVLVSYLSDEWGTYIVGEGQKFAGGAYEFRQKMKKYAIQKGFSYYYHRNDPVYISVDCECIECKFFVKGSVDPADNCFYIQSCQLIHTCSCVQRGVKHARLDSSVVAECMLTDVKYHPSIRPREIIRKFKVHYGFDIGYKVALNARSKALHKLYGKDFDSFNKLRWYADAVRGTNVGSYVDLEVDPATNRFKRMFIAYGACISGFAHCVPVLYVDGCFGKSMYKGQILAATSKNANKGNHTFKFYGYCGRFCFKFINLFFTNNNF